MRSCPKQWYSTYIGANGAMTIGYSKTTDEYRKELSKLFQNLKLKSQYFGTKGTIIVEDKYGECITRPYVLARGNPPSIKSAINRTNYYINRAKEVHGDKYDYSDLLYENASKKVKIICKKHGQFFQLPNAHLCGQGCFYCQQDHNGDSRRKSTSQFIFESKIKFKNKLNYSKCVYKNNKTKVELSCNDCGKTFFVRPSDHLDSFYGCTNCAKSYNNGWTRSDYISAARGRVCKIYVVKCSEDDGTVFFKIGMTMTSVRKRLSRGTAMPYDFRTIKIYEGCAGFIFDTERLVHNMHKEYRYLPKKYFAGETECFSKVMINKIDKIFKKL